MLWKAVVAVIACLISGPASSQSIALFGFEVGKKLTSTEGLTFVQEEADYFSYTRKFPSSKEYILQGLGISKRTSTIVVVDAMAPYQSEAGCSRQLAEIVVQLNDRFSGLTENITEAGGTVFHTLSRNRPNCSVKTRVGGMNLTMPCSSHFMVYCSGGRSLHLEASDSAYREQAREEAKEHALKSGRKHLD